jgi:hypothetical protein
MEGQFTSDGPDGFVTARMTFDINTTPAAGAVRVTPGTNSVCTVRAKEGFVIRSASFAIDSRDTDAAITRELLKHVEITEEVAGDSRPGTKAFVFTVKATDATRGKLVLDFPVSYR